MIVDSFAKNIDTLNRLNVAWCTCICINCVAFLACSLERQKSNELFPLIVGFLKELKIFLQSVNKKQDVFGLFTDWVSQEFDLPVASLNVKRNVELCMFCGCNCQAVGVNNEGKG